MSDPSFLTRSGAGIDHYIAEDDDGNLTDIAVQDVGPILEHNKTAQTNGVARSKDIRPCATIPIAVQYLWLTKYGVDIYSQDPEQQRKVAQLLDSSDWRYLRTTEFVIGDHWRKFI